MSHRHAPLLMEWALLEAEEGNDQIARELFTQGAAAGQQHPPLLAAWADFEQQRGRCVHMPPRCVYLCPVHCSPVNVPGNPHRFLSDFIPVVGPAKTKTWMLPLSLQYSQVLF